MSIIQLAPDADDRAIIDSIAEVLVAEAPLTELAARPLDVSDAVWGRAAELGWVLAGLAEENGGAGFDVTQEMLVNQTYGRFVAPVSLLATALYARAAATLGDSDALGIRCGFAARLPAAQGEGAVQLIDAVAERFVMVEGDGFTLLGHNDLDDVSLVESLDPTFTLARATISPGAGRRVEDSALSQVAELFIAAQLAGGALAATEMAAEYAKVRVQFGRPIGSFQAIGHMCADSIVLARAASNQAAMAALAIRESWPGADLQVSAASLVAADAAFSAATSNIQVHGAMGYSAESGAHLYLKRAQLWRRLLPAKAASQARLLDIA